MTIYNEKGRLFTSGERAIAGNPSDLPSLDFLSKNHYDDGRFEELYDAFAEASLSLDSEEYQEALDYLTRCREALRGLELNQEEMQSALETITETETKVRARIN